MLKVLFAGTPDVAVPSLKLLAQDTEHFEVVAVLTRPDAPTGRGRKLVANPVKQAALELGLPVIESDPSEETFVSELAATGAQAAAVVAYGKILKQDVLDALPMGWYNLHFSLLPQWRGAAPVQRSIWAGEKVLVPRFPHCARHGCRSDSGAIHRGNRRARNRRRASEPSC